MAFQTLRSGVALREVLLPNVLRHNHFHHRFRSVIRFHLPPPPPPPISAAMAERIRLKPYIVITFLMTIVHSISAHCEKKNFFFFLRDYFRKYLKFILLGVWSEDGFLKKLGCVDAAGCSGPSLDGGGGRGGGIIWVVGPLKINKYLGN